MKRFFILFICITLLTIACGKKGNNQTTSEATPKVDQKVDEKPSEIANETANKFSEFSVVIKDKKYGFIDKTGNIVIEPQYDLANDFYEGLACVRIGQKCGFIYTSGKIVINSTFYASGDFSDGLAYVVVNGASSFIDKTGAVVLNTSYSSSFEESYPRFYNGLVCLKDGADAVVVDKKGNVIFRQPEGSIQDFAEEMAVISFPQANGNKLTGFIDKTGIMVIQPQFDLALSFSEGLAGVKVGGDGGKFGYIDKTGKFIINPQFVSSNEFSEGLASVEVDGKWGFIDKTGKIVIQPQFEFAVSFSGGMAAVQLAQKWGFINKEGKFVVNPIHENARVFNGIGQVFNGSQTSYIDNTGKTIWTGEAPETYEH